MQKYGYSNPFSVSLNADLSVVWKILCVGGAAKVHSRPCHCCAVTSADLEVPNARHCTICQTIHSDKPNWKCYHHPMLTEETLDSLEEELLKISDSTVPEKEQRIEMESLINREEDPRIATANSRSNIQSSHYEPNTVAEKMQYMEFLEDKLGLRDENSELDLEYGSLSDKRKALRQFLLKEY